MNRMGIFTFQHALGSSTDPALRCYSLRLKNKFSDEFLGTCSLPRRLWEFVFIAQAVRFAASSWSFYRRPEIVSHRSSDVFTETRDKLVWYFSPNC
jgi:hypothetical protein